MSTKIFITWMNDRHISEKDILINSGEYFTLSFFYDQKTFQKKKKSFPKPISVFLLDYKKY